MYVSRGEVSVTCDVEILNEYLCDIHVHSICTFSNMHQASHVSYM